MLDEDPLPDLIPPDYPDTFENIKSAGYLL
jgi:hypothetical protein